MKNTKNLVILISGNGTNMQAIINKAKEENWLENLNAKISAVVSNRSDAKGLELAKKENIPAEILSHEDFNNRLDFDKELIKIIEKYNPHLIVLAGFLRILSSEFLNHFNDKNIGIINLHPSLLPAFKGLNPHQQAIDYGCKFAGCTVHWVITELDAGPILDQAVVKIFPDDNAITLSQRVLEQEHLIYPKVIKGLLL